MKNELILFTETFPYYPGESFLEAELPYLARSFGRVVIVPRFDGRGISPRKLPENVISLPPMMAKGLRPLPLLMRGVLNCASLRPFATVCSDENPLAGWWRFRSWLYAISVARIYLSDREIENLLRPSPGRVLYFYWSTNAGYFIPFIKGDHPPIISRFHSIDLYENRKENHGYIPFRSRLYNQLETAVAISTHGENHLLKSCNPPEKVKLHRLGVFDAGISHPSEDGVFRIVSCSLIIQVKQLHLIFEALKMTRHRIEWIHIGDGPLLENLSRSCKHLPKNINCRFLGWLNNDSVRQFYRENPCDLFLNVSCIEGVPVAVMEALSAGIPVMATAVSGTPELVDDTVGKLLSPQLTSNELAREIDLFKNRPQNERENLRAAARKRWAERCDAEQLYEEFANFLISLQ